MKKLLSILLAGSLLFGLAACGGGTDTPPEGNAQTPAADAAPKTQTDWPKKPISIIVPWSTGGNADIAVRILASMLEQELGQPVTVTNKASAGGVVATTAYMNAKPDGYELLASNDILKYMTPQVKKVDYDPDEIVPLCAIMRSSFAVIVSKDLNVHSIQELKDYAEANGPLTYATTSGPGATTYELMTALINKADIPAENVVFNGGMEVVNNVVGHHVDFGIGIVPLFNAYMKDGSLTCIASFSDEPYEIEGMEPVPTAKEQGFEISFDNANIICCRKGTPQEVVDRLSEALVKVCSSEEFQKQFEEKGMEPLCLAGEDLTVFLDGQEQRIGDILKENYG